ncbi:uncharacterized protein LOC120452484 [Drosophila santomea]|uniref:uncharacterized protein LOC120452484 n=1 Tax=Drosophila santomea TaxID=129105 RepID=UPI001954D2AE|nr:uncharacterized protein LOC120452484 [Drosophila santomea]
MRTEARCSGEERENPETAWLSCEESQREALSAVYLYLVDAVWLASGKKQTAGEMARRARRSISCCSRTHIRCCVTLCSPQAKSTVIPQPLSFVQKASLRDWAAQNARWPVRPAPLTHLCWPGQNHERNTYGCSKGRLCAPDDDDDGEDDAGATDRVVQVAELYLTSISP